MDANGSPADSHASNDTALEQLLRDLAHWEPAVRAAAATALGQQAAPRIGAALLHTLHDPASVVRRAGVEALGQHGDRLAVQPLITALQSDPDSVVRRRAATALGTLGDPGAIVPLIHALQDVRGGVAGYAALALDALGAEWSPPFSEGIGIADVLQRRAIVRALRAFQWHGQRPLGVFVAALHDPDSQVRAGALLALADRADPRTVEPLLAVLSEPDPWSRERAAEGLGATGDRRAVPALIQAAGDARGDTYAYARGAAIRALRRIDDPQAIAPLIELLKQSNITMRAKVSFELGHWPQHGLLALLSLLNETDSKLRWWAVVGLKYHGAVAFADVAGTLRDPDPEVRSEVIHALADMDPQRAIAPLIKALNDPQPNVRWDAAGTLGRVGDESAIAPLQRIRANDSAKSNYDTFMPFIRERADFSIWAIRHRQNPKLVRIDGVAYHITDEGLQPAPDWEQGG